MRFLFLGFLVLAAFGLITAVLIGVAIRLVLLIAFAVAGLAIAGWVMRRVKSPRHTLILDHPLDGERLPR
jgi:hypothetical protein